jgi:hypothetical protein
MVVARGQTFLHMPGTTTKRAGATGIRIFQNNVIPSDGKNKRQLNMITPISQNTSWAIRHSIIVLGEN